MAIGMTDCRYRVDLLRGIRNLPLLCVCCQIRTEWVGLVSQICPEAGVGGGGGEGGLGTYVMLVPSASTSIASRSCPWTHIHGLAPAVLRTLPL